MQVQGLSVPVFPLVLASQFLDGYFVSSAGDIYSTRSARGQGAVRLSGSKTPSGRYFTLNKRTYRYDDVIRMARNHKDFAKHTVATGQAVYKPMATTPGVRTNSAQQAVASKGFVLATMNPNGKLVFGTEPMYHLTDKSARAEAERVATVSGNEIVLLQIIGKVKVQKAVWE